MRTPAKRAFTLVELLVVITIIGILIALLLPAVQAAREAARRIHCCGQLKQIGLTLHNYAQGHGVFPPGCIVSTGNPPGWDPWLEATSTTGLNQHGTSWMLQVLPYLEQQNIYSRWDFRQNVLANAVTAQVDLRGFYCPSRRSGIRAEDKSRLLVDTWTGGGNDYGGCIGSGNGWTNNDAKRFTNSTPHDPSEHWEIPNRTGIFLPRRSVGLSSVRDGTSSTIMIGELQRLSDTSNYRVKSHDGWATGGSATLFTTNNHENTGPGGGPGYQTGGLNNLFFESPGSDHPGGAHLGMADGSVHFIANGIDTLLFRYLGGMADGQPAQVPQ